MNYMTTTDLRTQSPQLVERLKRGESVSLIHRSKLVGIIQPVPVAHKPFDARLFEQYRAKLNLPHTTPAQRKAIYTAHLQKKYGKNLP